MRKFVKNLEERGYKSATTINYTHGVNTFFSFLDANNIKLNKLTIDVLMSYRQFLTDKYSNQSLYSKIYSVISLLKFINLNIDYDKLVFGVAKTRKKNINVVSEKDFLDIISRISKESISGLRDSLILKLLYYTGIKLQDLILLNKNDINYGLIEVGGKIIPINYEIQKDLKNYLNARQDNDSGLLISTMPGRKISKLTIRSIENIYNKYTKTLVNSPTINDLRNSYAINLVGRSQEYEITKIYTHTEITHAGEFLSL